MRRRGAGILMAVLAVLAACAPLPPITGGYAGCTELFREYDVTARAGREVQDPVTGETRARSRLARLAQELVRRDCLTRPDDLAGLEGAAAGRSGIAESGAALARPLAVHAGAVTSDEDAARAVAFFNGLGLQARSVGEPLLGRRVYAGPVATQGGLLELVLLATDAGFTAPYPTEDFRF